MPSQSLAHAAAAGPGVGSVLLGAAPAAALSRGVVSATTPPSPPAQPSSPWPPNLWHH